MREYTVRIYFTDNEKCEYENVKGFVYTPIYVSFCDSNGWEYVIPLANVFQIVYRTTKED